jgi:hypothetical protein
MKTTHRIYLTIVGLFLAGGTLCRADLQNAAYRADATATNQLGAGWTAAHAVNEVAGNEGWHSIGGTTNPWWRVDLGAVVPIDSLVVQGRAGFIGRINGCSLTVHESADATGAPIYSNVVQIRSGQNQTFALPAGTYGRSVRVSYPGVHPQLTVNLSEVYAYSENLAQGKPATMSTSHGSGSGPEMVVDGTRPAEFPSIAHSSGADDNPWLKIDLEGLCLIDSVRLWNRNSSQDRMTDYNVQVLASDDATVLYDYSVTHGTLINPTNVLGSPVVITVDLHGDAVEGRYVKLIRALPAGASNVLQLAEVEVFGSTLVENRTATEVAAYSAVLNGFVNGTNTTTSVKVYWGNVDQGTNWTQWAGTNIVGLSGTGAVSTAVAGLALDTTYYYRFSAGHAGGTGYAPASGRLRTVPASSGLVAWYSAEALGLTNGASVADWQDSSPAGDYDLSQAGAAARPTFRTNVFNGRPAAHFNGSNSLWAGNLQADWPSDSTTIFFVTRADTIKANEFYRADPNDNTDRFLSHYAYGNGNTYFDFGNISGGGRLQWPNNSVTSLNVVCYWQQAGVGQRAYRNGELLNSDNDTSAFSVHGYKWLLGNGYHGDIAEMLVYNRALSSFEKTLVESFLAEKHGIATTGVMVDNADGASPIEDTTATLNGNLYTTDSGQSTVVKVFYGGTDGGTAPGAWDSTNDFGAVTEPQEFALPLTGLQSAETVYYRFYASNSVSGPVWADSTAVFKTDFSDAPGDIALWLAADTITGLTNGQSVSVWPDLSGNGVDAVQTNPAAQPQFLTDVAGGEPVVYNGTNGTTLTLTTPVSTMGRTIVLVHRQNPAQTLWTLALGGNLHTTQNNGTFCLTRSGGAIAVASTVSSRQFSVNFLQMVAGDYRLWANGAPFGPDARTTGFSPLTAVGSNFHGDFAEIIVFNGMLGEAGRREVGRYLGEKYGIAVAHGKHDLPVAAADPVIWYDLDSEIGITNSQAIAALQDFSGNGNRAVSQATVNFPTYTTNAAGAFGGKPVVRFDGSNDNWFAFTERADIRTVFWVMAEDTNVAAGGPRPLLGDDNTYNFHRSDPPNRFFWHGAHTHINIRNGLTTVDGEQVNGLQEPVPTVASIVAVRTVGAVTASRLMKDRGIAGRTWDGDLAELLVYNRALSDHEMAQVGYYLEEKYALSTGFDVVDNADGATDVTLDAAFLNGKLNSTGGEGTTVKVFWGTTDGGASFGGWDGTNTFAETSSPQEFTWPVSGLDPATVYYYRFYASNGLGEAWAGTTAAFETLFGTTTNGLQLWLDAQTIVGTNGAPVRRWADQSGNALDAVQLAAGTRPVVSHAVANGRAAVRFEPAEFLDTAVLPDTWPTNAATVFVVTRSDNITQQNYVFAATPINNANRFASHLPWSGSAYWDFGDINGDVGRVFCPHDGGTEWNVWLLSRGEEGMRVERNGVPKVRKSGGGTFNPAGLWLRLGVGMQGEIAEVLVYNRELSPLEEREVGLYLQERYSLGTAYETVDNSIGADPVGQTTATLNGNLADVDAAAPATVAVYWGPADGGTDTNGWAATNTFGSYAEPTAFALTVSNLVPTTTYYYRFRGETSAATNWASETASFRTHGHDVTAGLELWLDAASVTGVTNGGAVTELLDWSGRHADAVQTNVLQQPSLQTNALNGQPVVHFDGVTNLMDGVFGVTARSILIVCKLDTGAPNLSGVFCQKNADGQNIRSQSATQWRETGSTANPADFCYNGAININGQFGSAHNNQYHLLHQVSDDAPSFDYRLSQPLHSRWFKGDVAEVLIYNRDLTVAEQYELGEYFENRYGIAIDYPVIDVAGVGALAATQATVDGNLAVSNATVRLYYGTADGASDPGAWDTSVLATNQAIGDVALDATGLSPETTYYARYYATNSETFGWSPNVAEFYTQPEIPVRDGMSLWYTANILSSGHSDGQRVATWTDLSGNERHGTSDVGNPVFKANVAGGMPVVRFDGGTNTFFTFPRLDDIRTVFWVIREDADATFPRFMLGSEGIGNIYHFHRVPGAEKYMWNANAHLNVRNGVTMLNGQVVNGTTTAVPTDRMAVISLRTIGNVTANAFVSDRLSRGVTPARTWDGDLAELIIYGRALSDAEELEVGKYLARRYKLETKYTPSGTVLMVR